MSNAPFSEHQLEHQLPEHQLSSEEQIRRLAKGESVVSSQALLARLDELGLEFEQSAATKVDSGEAGQVRLAMPLQLLDKPLILNELRAPVRACLGDVTLHWVIDSTNNDLLKKAGAEGFHGGVSLAEQQLAGKGRRGKQWVSPFGKNIYLSVGWQFRVPVSALGGLSLVAGMQVVKTLRQLGVQTAGLKWPNDVLLEGGKLAGILVEVLPDKDRVSVVLGIGINLALSKRDTQAIDQAWSVVPESIKLARNQIVVGLLNNLIPVLQAFEGTGFAPYGAAWQGFNLYQGRAVEVRLGERVIQGIDHGIDASGQLQVLTEEGLQVFNAGEVSLRLAG